MAGSGRKWGNYATLRNISQSKKYKGAGAKKYRAGTGIKGYGKREVQTPLSPPTCQRACRDKICCSVIGDWGERRGVGGGKGKVGLSERKICRCYTLKATLLK